MNEDVILVYIDNRIRFHFKIIEEQTPKLPDMVASSKIDVSENIIEEFQKLYDLI
jgi:hypothetical protein